ncbi:MAG: hypothetical protein IKZ41_04315, partial [Clostridia bacterium]|nr:hypothetical protein [Clostridia bacterium]
LGETKNGGHTCSGTELVNWLASGVSPDTISAVAVADAESVAAVRLTWEGRRFDLLLFTPAEEERTPLTVAVFAESAGVRQRINEAVGAFNRTNGDYAAVLVDFTVYQADVRMTLFNAEMAAGRIPDAVIIEKRDADDDTVWTYAHNGVFCDLAPILSERSSFRYDKLLGFRTKPYTENGEQRAFPLSAQIMTNFAAAGDLSGPMTAEETVEAIRALPEGVRWTPQHFFRHDILTGIMSDFVDWNTFTCSFGDGRFAAILASLDTLEEGRREQGAVSTAWQAWSAVGEGRVRTNYDSASSLVEYAVIRAFVGGEVAAVGFPNAQRRLLVNNSGGTFFGIPEASEHKDGAAAILETILGTLRDGGATFYPEDVAADFEAVRDKTVVLSNAGRTLVDDDAVPESAVLAFKVTEDDRDAYLAFLDAIDGVLATDTPVWEIYAEECFDGRDRKPEDVASVIQSRVAILLAERS